MWIWLEEENALYLAVECSACSLDYPCHPREDVLRFNHMGHTITVRLTEKLAAWLKQTATRTGLPQGRIIRDQLERAIQDSERPFMRLAGSLDGPRDLSSRKGFSRS